jgi:hypothetical protein
MVCQSYSVREFDNLSGQLGDVRKIGGVNFKKKEKDARSYNVNGFFASFSVYPPISLYKKLAITNPLAKTLNR